jgi:hypothetical protein
MARRDRGCAILKNYRPLGDKELMNGKKIATVAPIGPPRNFGRRERRKTIEASAKGAGLHLGAVQNAMLVRLDMRWIEAVRAHSEGEGGCDT